MCEVKFIKGNLRLVLSIIKRFSNTDENVDDLFQIGCIGLIKVLDAIHRLPIKERNIVDLCFFKGKTQVEVANEVGISQTQVSRLEKSAIKSMRKYLQP